MRKFKRYGMAYIVLTIIITIFAAAIGSGGFMTCLMYGLFFSLFIIVAVWAVGAAVRNERRKSRRSSSSSTRTTYVDPLKKRDPQTGATLEEMAWYDTASPEERDSFQW